MSGTTPPNDLLSEVAGTQLPAERGVPMLLGETRGVRLWRWSGQGPGTLILFAPAVPAGPRGWWLAKRLGWETLVFAALGPAGYPAEEMTDLLSTALATLPSGPRVTYGVGMGGYGALKFGRALGARATVALAPLYSIDPADMPADARARRHFDPRRHLGMAVRTEDLAGLPIILTDSFALRDHAHARRLAALPGVRVVDMRRGGAVLPRILVETGRVRALLTAALCGEEARAVGLLREMRRVSPTLRGLVAEALEARGRAAWAAAVRQPAAPRPQPPAARLAAEARLLRERGEHDAEEKVLRRWIAVDAASVVARVNLARCLQALARDTEAAPVLLDALSDGLRDQRLFRHLIGLLRSLGETKAALEAAEGAVVAAPGDADALAQLGETRKWAGQSEAAGQAYAQALAAQPGHRNAQLGLISIVFEDGSCESHLTTLVDAFTAGSAPRSEWLGLVDRFRHVGRHEAAIRVAGAASTAYPDEIAFPLRKGSVMLRAGQEEAAVAHLREVVEARPEVALTWHALSETLMVLKRHVEGRDVLRRGAAEHPGDLIIQTRLAAFLLALEETDAAEQVAKRVIALDPTAEGGYLILIDALRRRGQHGDAIQLAQRTLQSMLEGGAHVAERLGHLLLGAGDVAGAAEAFIRATAAPGVAWQAWLGLAESLQAAGRAAEAEDALRRGLEAWPTPPALKIRLGDLLLSRGEDDAARQMLADAVSEEAGSSAADVAFVDALLRQGRQREAFHLLAATVEREPGHVEVELRLGTMLLDEGRHDDAATLFTRIVEAVPELPAGWVGLADAERLRKRVKPALAAYRQAIATGASGQVLRQLRFRLFGDYDG